MNVLLIVMIPGFLIWFANSLAFDSFIEYLHDHYYDEWVKCGKPRGMFFNPKNSSMFSFYAQGFTLHKKIPEWAETDSVAINKYQNYMFWNKVNKMYLILLFPLIFVLLLAGV